MSSNLKHFSGKADVLFEASVSVCVKTPTKMFSMHVKAVFNMKYVSVGTIFGLYALGKKK